MHRPWFAIVWFAVWGVFQAVAVSMVLAGTWQKPEAFPEEAYRSLIYPDMAFIPLDLLASALLWMRHRLGTIIALVASGGILYVLIYLFALSGFRGAVNLVADAVFLVCTPFALWQVASGVGGGRPVRPSPPAQFNVHSARFDTSLTKMRLPDKVGCVQVSDSATV